MTLADTMPRMGYTDPAPFVVVDDADRPATLDGAMIAKMQNAGEGCVLYRFQTEAEAVTLSNDTEYGLAAYVCSDDLTRTLRVGRARDTGLIGMNRGLLSDPAAPFGGAKQSDIGREGGVTGILDFMEAKYFAVGF